MDRYQQRIAREAAKEAIEELLRGPALQELVEHAVNSTLEKIGVDTKNPAEMREDLITLRNWRETFQDVRRKGIGTIVTALITLAMTALGIGMAVLFHR